jgi:hypothetical protein
MRVPQAPAFWWSSTGSAVAFGWFLLFLLDVDRSGFQAAMAVGTATTSAILAGAVYRSGRTPPGSA